MNNLEKGLLQRIKKGDKKAFDQLFENHFSKLCHYAYLMVREEDAAEDIVTEVFYQFWCKRNELQIKVSVRKYLFRSIHNMALNYLKHEGIVKQYKDLNIVMHREKEILSDNYNTSPLKLLEYKEMESLINQAIEELPDQCRQVFEMNRFKGMKYREIAKEMSISLSTVKYHMSTALQTLKEKLNKYL